MNMRSVHTVEQAKSIVSKIMFNLRSLGVVSTLSSKKNTQVTSVTMVLSDLCVNIFL